MMRQRLASWARVAAPVGAVAALASLGALLVVGEATLWIDLLGAAGVLLMMLPIVIDPTRTRAALLGRQARHGGNAVVMTVAFVGIVALLNYIGARHPQRWDVTEERQFSLSQQTEQILDSLTEPVHAVLFFTPGNYNRQQADDLMQEYALRSDAFTYEIVDPDLEPRRALEYQVGRDGTIVFERGARREYCFGVQEQDLTGALLKVKGDHTPGVYFATGHQERDPQGSDESAYTQLARMLATENYQVNTFNLAVTDTVPSDMDVLVIAAPQVAFSPDEIARVRAFIDQGVGVLALLEPGAPDPLGGLLSEYGVMLSDDLVIDPGRSFFGDLAAPLVDRYPYHQITKDLTGLSTIFPTVRAVEPVEPAPEGWAVTLLAQSSASAWAETAYVAEQVAQDPEEASGPLGLMATIEPQGEPEGRGRLVVVGDTDFATNEVLAAVRGIANIDLFMNAIGWLAEEDELISIRPKEYQMRSVVLTSPQSRAVVYGSIIFLPLSVLLAGGLVWWRRR